MSIENTQVSYRIGHRFKFEPGQAVVCNGYPGTVAGMYSEGMVEVRVPGGLVCVSASYPDCYPRPAEEPQLKAIIAMNAMWSLSSTLVEKHGMDGDDTMTDEEHQIWQESVGLCHDALRETPAAILESLGYLRLQNASSQMGFDWALMVIGEMLHVHLPEETVEVMLDKLRDEKAKFLALGGIAAVVSASESSS